MSGRRDQQLHFRVSKPELDRIHVKMAELGIVSIGAYLRKMALDGYCIRLDLKELNRMALPAANVQQQPEPVRKACQRERQNLSGGHG